MVTATSQECRTRPELYPIGNAVAAEPANKGGLKIQRLSDLDRSHRENETISTGILETLAYLIELRGKRPKRLAANGEQLCEGWALLVLLPNTCTKAK